LEQLFSRKQMKGPSIRYRLPVLVLGAAFLFTSPILAQDTPNLLSKALGLVRKIENPGTIPLTDAQRIEALTQAMQMARQAPNHRLQGHRVLAVQAMRSALASIQAGEHDQVAGFLHTADVELSTSISLAGIAESPGQTPGSASATPGAASPTTQTAPDAQGYIILHNFSDGSVPQDGANPCASLVQGSDGDLYGVTHTLDIETSGNGTTEFPGKTATLFKSTLQGHMTVLRSFDAGKSDNDPLPEDALTLGTDGNLYGVIPGGGDNSCGIAFRLTSQGGFTALYQFGKPGVKDDPRGPTAPLIRGADGNFYGTSNIGGSADAGTVFRLTPQGAVTTLHSFDDGSVLRDGDTPWAPVMQEPDGNLYGTTFNGSGAHDKVDFKGTLYRLTLGGKLTILHRFDDGSVPNDGKADSGSGLFAARDHTLYGTTHTGSGTATSGTFFKFTPDGSVTILHVFNADFSGKDGVFPEPTLVEGPDGNFYGTTEDGGTANNGTIYQITPTGNVTILHSFGDKAIPHDGIEPRAGLVLANDGYLYGTASQGGTAGKGVLFRIKCP
jgi:uncharacterized repeat protein (TIGR03803 family)